VRSRRQSASDRKQIFPRRIALAKGRSVHAAGFQNVRRFSKAVHAGPSAAISRPSRRCSCVGAAPSGRSAACARQRRRSARQDVLQCLHTPQVSNRWRVRKERSKEFAGVAQPPDADAQRMPVLLVLPIDAPRGSERLAIKRFEGLCAHLLQGRTLVSCMQHRARRKNSSNAREDQDAACLRQAAARLRRATGTISRGRA